MELSYNDLTRDLAYFKSLGANQAALDRVEGFINHSFILMNKYSELELKVERLQAAILHYKEMNFGQANGTTDADNDPEPACDATPDNEHEPDQTQASSDTHEGDRKDPEEEISPEPDMVEDTESNSAESEITEEKPEERAPEPDNQERGSPNPGGRLSFDDYPKAPIITCQHDHLKAGDVCPDCLQSRLYAIDPNRKVLIDGQSPFLVSRYLIEVLRCALCGAIFKAQAPVDVSQKYTPAAKAVLAYLHYGAGLTYYGIERMQQTQKAPIPLSTQSELVESAAGPVFALTNYLALLGRESELIVQDDTPVRVLELMHENKTQNPDRKGMYTTGFVFKNEHPFVLYFSGRNHAGENFDTLMEGRESDTVPTRVADALSANSKHNAIADQGKCNAHPFRKFRTLMTLFPDEANWVLDIYGQVFGHEKHCKKEDYPPDKRLIYHQTHSQPLMEALFNGARELLNQDKVEPNSVLGKTLQYLLNHEFGLTLFLRKAGVPLDSNEVERVLKEMIRYRKRSLFFGTCYSADYGSRYMSLIATCHMHKVDAIDYLTQIQIHEERIWADLGAWLPWNYHYNITQAA